MKRILLVLLVFEIVAGLTFLMWPKEREPEYQGKTLTQWLQVGYFSLSGSAKEQEATHALQQIGTNALPFLVRAIAYKRSSLVDWEVQQIRKTANNGNAPSGVLLFMMKKLVEGDRRATWAEFGFKTLGPAASPVVPELVKLMNRADREVCSRACDALWRVGTQGVAPLLIALSDEKHPNRDIIASGLVHLSYSGARTNMGSAVPVLVRCLNEKDDAIVGPAADAIGGLAIEPEVCVPALIDLLQRTNSRARVVALSSLRRFGQSARSALPLLVRCFSDNNAYVVGQAARIVGNLAIEADCCVPALEGLIQNTNWIVRSAAMDSLRGFGRDALPAVPALIGCLEDPDEAVRTKATNALRRIVPEVMSNGVWKWGNRNY